MARGNGDELLEKESPDTPALRTRGHRDRLDIGVRGQEVGTRVAEDAGVVDGHDVFARRLRQLAPELLGTPRIHREDRFLDRMHGLDIGPAHRPQCHLGHAAPPGATASGRRM